MQSDSSNVPELDLLGDDEKTLTDLNPLTQEEIAELEALAKLIKVEA